MPKRKHEEITEEKKEPVKRGRAAKATTKAKVTAKAKAPTKAKEAEPAPPKSKSPTKAKEAAPAPTKRKAPTKAKDAAPAPTKNKTSTSYEDIDFKTCETKNGKEWNLKIASWNVDGLRAWLKKGGLDYIKYEDPDILCLQETKCSESKLPEEVNVEGYKIYWHNSKKEGYAGVGLYSKTEPINVTYGIGDDEHDSEGRMITAEYKHFYLISVYVPNAGRGLVTLDKRLDWNKHFKDYVAELDKKKPVIICGDMNVSHNEIDLTNPKTNTKNAGFTKQEREGMTDFLGDGYIDTFRHLYPEEKSYTFWSYMSNARAKNIGWRLDYFIVSERLIDNVCDNVIRKEVFGSDHCPMALFLNID